MNWLDLKKFSATFLVLAITVSAHAQVGIHGGQIYEYANGNKLEVTQNEVYFHDGDKNYLVGRGEAKGITVGQNQFDISLMLNGSKLVVLSNGDSYQPGKQQPASPNEHRVRFRPKEEFPAILVTYHPELERHSVTLIQDANNRMSLDEGTVRAVHTNHGSREHFPLDSAKPYMPSEPYKDRTIPEPRDLDRLAETAIAINVDERSSFIPLEHQRTNFIISEHGGRTPIFFNLETTDNLQIFPFQLKDFTRGWFISGRIYTGKDSQEIPLTVAVRGYDGAFVNLLGKETPIRNMAAFGQSAEVIEALAGGFEKYRHDGFNQPPVLKNFTLPTLVGAELPSVRYRNRTTEQTMEAKGINRTEGLTTQETLMAEVLYFLDSNGMKEEMRKLEAMEYTDYRAVLLMHMYDITVNNFYTRESRKAALRVLLDGDFGRTLSPNRRACLWLMGDKWKESP